MRTPILVTLVSFALPAIAADFTRNVSVAGQCHREIVPDRGSITLTSEVQDDQISRASDRASQQYSKVKSAIEAKGLKDIEFRTVEYNVSEVREWIKNKMVSKGFKARIALRVTTSDIKRLGEVISIAAQEEVRDVGALQTYVSDTLYAKTHEECLADAVKDARAKADKMATAVGAHVGSPISLREEGVPEPQPPMPMMRAKTFMAEDAGSPPAAPPVEAGKSDINVRVIGTFELK